MSFKCQNCGIHQQSRTKPHKVVTQVRKVIYPPVRDRDGGIRYIPEGKEINKELNVCQKCFELFNLYDYNCKVVGSKIIEESRGKLI